VRDLDYPRLSSAVIGFLSMRCSGGRGSARSLPSSCAFARRRDVVEGEVVGFPVSRRAVGTAGSERRARRDRDACAPSASSSLEAMLPGGCRRRGSGRCFFGSLSADVTGYRNYLACASRILRRRSCGNSRTITSTWNSARAAAAHPVAEPAGRSLVAELVSVGQTGAQPAFRFRTTVFRRWSRLGCTGSGGQPSGQSAAREWGFRSTRLSSGCPSEGNAATPALTFS
jgi:hypothetical protein